MGELLPAASLRMDHGVDNELASDDSIGGCHADPASGGSSPAVNPYGAVVAKEGRSRNVLDFLSAR